MKLAVLLTLTKAPAALYPISHIFRDVTRGLNQVLLNQVKKCAGTSGNSSVFPQTLGGKCANASGARQATPEVVAPDAQIPYQGEIESLNQPFILDF